MLKLSTHWHNLSQIYFGFWFLSLYKWDWGTRKFKTDSLPTTARMIHNIWYSTLGALHWTAWEVILVHCYATGKLAFISDAEAFATPAAAVSP